MPAVTTTRRSVRGISIFERRSGEGPPTVVLHGGPGADHGYLLPGFDALASGRTLIYYDQRGGGRSPVDRETPVGWREQVADLEALRGQWGIDRLSLAGYSWGALLAMLYAIEHPGTVARLALVSPAPVWKAAREEFERRFAERANAPWIRQERDRLRSSGLQQSDPAAYRQRAFELSVAGYFHDPARVHQLTPFRVSGRTQHDVWASLGDFDLRPHLEALALSAIVLHGDDDPIPRESAAEAARCLKADFHLLAGCGHVPYVEALPEFTRLLDAFLPKAG